MLIPLLAGCGLFILENVLKRVANRDRVLSIARMSMNWNVQDILQHLNRLHEPFDTNAKDTIAAANNQFTTKEFYELLNFKQYDDIDIHEDEGATIVHDMNVEIPQLLHNAFDPFP